MRKGGEGGDVEGLGVGDYSVLDIFFECCLVAGWYGCRGCVVAWRRPQGSPVCADALEAPQMCCGDLLRG